MKNVAILNTCDWGSTGKIAISLCANLTDRGYNAHFFYGRGEESKEKHLHRIDSQIEVYTHVFLAGLTGLQGGFSNSATRKLILSLKQLKIDTIIVVSIQGYYINEKMFLNFVADNNIRLVYTMIDAYSYAGACCTDPVCEKIKTGKGRCPDIKKYPKSYFIDNCSRVLKRKTDCYKKMKNTVFVGPEYLVRCSQQSILGPYMNTVILDEAIDLQLYQPYDPSDLIKKHNIDKEKIVVLCVAPTNNPTRGSEFFIDAAKRLAADNRYVLIHVGYKKEDVQGLGNNFIPISFVEKDIDLARYYSMADVLMNPSITDAMSNTCLEALACGTPLICFNLSGMPYLMDETVGTLIQPRSVDAIVCAIQNSKKKDKHTADTCRNYALRRYDNREYVGKLIAIAEANI